MSMCVCVYVSMFRGSWSRGMLSVLEFFGGEGGCGCVFVYVEVLV